MSLSSPRKTDAVRRVLTFVVRSWRARWPLVAGLTGAITLATLAEVLLPLYAGRLVDALSGSERGAALDADTTKDVWIMRATGAGQAPLAASPQTATLDAAGRAEMLIVASGARRDLGQPEAAALILQGPELRPDARRAWSARLFYAYAEALLAAGRISEATQWFSAALAADAQGETDAGDRWDELTGVSFSERPDDGADEAVHTPAMESGRPQPYV